MILTSILLILILLFFNYDTSNLSNQVTGTPILFQSNNLFTNVKESTPKLFSQIFSGISLPNEKLLSTKCKKSYDICKEIFYQKISKNTKKWIGDCTWQNERIDIVYMLYEKT